MKKRRKMGKPRQIDISEAESNEVYVYVDNCVQNAVYGKGIKRGSDKTMTAEEARCANDKLIGSKNTWRWVEKKLMIRK